MSRLLIFILILWITNKIFRILLPTSKKSHESSPENKPRQSRQNMDFKDGFFTDNEEHKIAIVQKIRQYRPAIVLTNAISDRHPDHSRSSKITVDACFLAGLEKIKTGQKVFRPKAIYHYIQFNNLSPDIVVDISEQIDLKLKAVKAYSTQFFNPDSKESETIISSSEFLESVTYRAQDLGRQSNCEYAEGFISHQIPKANSLLDL